ncbi:MAG: chloride channel protein [Clostridia bacterium]|nr:chloride channel protein [Clostridia bacterium]
MRRKFKSYFINLTVPAVVFGSITGVLVGVVVTFFRWCAAHAMRLSEYLYGVIRGNFLWLIAAVAVFFGVSVAFSRIYKAMPIVGGGGIPTSIGILRGVLTFKWLKTLICTSVMSLTVLVSGVPLGSMGAAVQIGTALGKGSVSVAKKHTAWQRYCMTGGACASFTLATGAPISGILFAVEEAHQRISPMIVMVSSISVIMARLTTEMLSPTLELSIGLFPEMQLQRLTLSEVWIPLLVGLVMGVFAVFFLMYYRGIKHFFNHTLRRVPHSAKIFSVFMLTLIFGTLSFSFISTGRELIVSLIAQRPAWWMLIALLLVRSTVTISASTNRLTGGLFLPVLSVGVVVAAMLGEGLVTILGLSHVYYDTVLMLGIAACISGAMKMPLTAIIFSVEALSCYENILYVIIASGVSFVITEIFELKSVDENVLAARVEEMNNDKEQTVIDTFVTVREGSFAVDKQIRDIFWPANLFVLSVKHDETRKAEVDEHGGKTLRVGDILHVRYSTYDPVSARDELIAIVGIQEYDESAADLI